MRIYVFGNQDLKSDSLAIKTAKKLEGKIKNIKFVQVKPNEDLPFIGEDNVVILDVVLGIKKVTKIDEKDLDKLIVGKSVTVHDFDLGFQLKYLKKLGKLKKITIIGLPQKGDVNHSQLLFLLKKLSLHSSRNQ